MKLYTSKTTFKDIDLKDDSYRLRSIAGEHNLTLLFDLPEFYEFPIGTYCDFQGERYTLLKAQDFKKINDCHYEYTLVMDSEAGLLTAVRFKDLASQKVKFSITATPREYIRLLVDVLNQSDTKGWTIGDTLDKAEKTIVFNHQSCAEALQTIAQAFETEWEIIGKKIHLRKVEHNADNPLPLAYGKGKGFKSGIGRTTQTQRITRLYVQGGERNIDRSKYGNDSLLLPANQEIEYQGVTYKTDPKGLYIERKEKENFTYEASLDLSNIYPKRVGTVSEVIVKDKDKHEYDFTDSTIPAPLDFTKYQVKGQTLSVIFESGMLSGREFEVNYKHAERRFELIAKEEDGRTMPDDTFKPAKGDKYAVFGMMMPQEYINNPADKSGASFEMLREALKYFAEHEQDKFTFTGELDGIWAKKRWENVGGRIVLGGYVNFTDPHFKPNGIKIRIISIKDYINNPHSPVIELSNEVVGAGAISSLFGKIKENEVIREDIYKKSVDFTRRRFKDAQQSAKMIEDAFKNFSKSLNPATLHTMQALVGDKSGQFRFVSSRVNPQERGLNVGFDVAHKQLHVPQAILQHLTIGVEAVKPNRPVKEYRFWDLPEFTSGSLDAAEKTYYLYVKANKANDTGEFLLSENTIATEGVAGYYHFLVGLVSSEADGSRSFVPTYGFTEILPGQINVRKLSSTDGKQYIELLSDKVKIVGDVTFTDNSPALKQVEKATKDELDKLKIGGRNLLLKSKERKTVTATTPEESWLAEWKLSQPLKEGETYIFDVTSYKQVPRYFLWDGAWGTDQEIFPQKPFVAKRGYTLMKAHQSGLPYNLDIEKAKLEKGNVVTDWSPAPEDLEEPFQNLHIGNKNFVLNSRITMSSAAHADGGTFSEVDDPIFGKVVKYSRPEGGGNFQFEFDVKNRAYLNGKDLIYLVIAKPIQEVRFYFGIWDKTYTVISNNSNKKDLGNGWYCYWAKVKAENVGAGVCGINTVGGEWLFYAVGIFEGTHFVDWTPVTADLELEQENIKKTAATLAKKTDFLTETTIKGNTIATGTLQVGNSKGANAGITGTGEGADAVRFYAGSDYEHLNKAKFLVTDSGKLKATEAEISGAINSTKGNIGSFEISNSYLKSGDEMRSLLLSENLVAFKDDYDGVDVRFGSSVLPLTSGIKGFKYTSYKPKSPYDGAIGDYVDMTGLDISFSNIAGLKPYGHVFASVRLGKSLQVGSHSVFETEYIGEANPNVIKSNIGTTQVYVLYTTQDGENVVYLPGASDLQMILGTSDVTFRLEIFMKVNSPGYIQVRGVADGVLLNNQNGIWNGGFGKRNLDGADSLILRYSQSHYYLISNGN